MGWNGRDETIETVDELKPCGVYVGLMAYGSGRHYGREWSVRTVSVL